MVEFFICRCKHATYSRYDRWSPEEEAYYISKLVALVVSPVHVIDANHESEAAAPPFEEVNPLAIIVYDGGNAGAAGDVNGDMGRHISDVD
ncbi:hypothetical protein ACJIZ3_019870 [Penstemon smallii]|uniref:Uncharacterized protein n=1 Tax=Penstemon smallii TaxID=265156 RepID=A0ABD3T355_9LAMI